MAILPWRVGGLALCVGLAAGCGGGGGDDAAVGTTDAVAGEIDAARSCESTDDCSDGLACNGDESCEDGRCVAGTPMRCDDMLDCTTDFCSEELRRCVNRPADADGDGSADLDCVDDRGMPLGEDCDDSMASVRPGMPELCDMGTDEDCDPTTLGVDSDGDGFVAATCCNGTTCGDDCNDGVRGANPRGSEVCNGIDDDCDGTVDEGMRVAIYRDADGDGHGNRTMTMMSCGIQPGYVLLDDDCDDANPRNSPTLPEICDRADNDCDGNPDPGDSTVTATWYEDADGDGFGQPLTTTVSCAVPTGRWSLLRTDCNDSEPAIHPGVREACNAIDDDCDGLVNFSIAPGDLEDDDRDGVADARCMPTPTPADCDDRNPSSGPGTAELCDGLDNDCDGTVDEMVASFAYFRDGDGDGYGGGAGGVVVGCVPTPGYVLRGGDCDDMDPNRYPGARERCAMMRGGLDDDCDGAIDEAPASTDCPSGVHAIQACLTGQCRIVSCDMGFTDCDGSATNGCEQMGACP